MNGAHLEAERKEILAYIKARHNTVLLLKRRSALGERRIQRRLNELLSAGWIEQVASRSRPTGGSLRIFGLTAAGMENVPSRR